MYDDFSLFYLRNKGIIKISLHYKQLSQNENPAEKVEASHTIMHKIQNNHSRSTLKVPYVTENICPVQKSDVNGYRQKWCHECLC